MAFSYHPPRHTDGNYCVFPADMRTWEAAEINEIPNRGRELMEIAGREVACHILNHYKGTREVLIFCGVGNNGGDSLVAAYYLERCGLDIHLFAFEDAVVRTPDAQFMFERVRHLPRTVLRENSDAAKILEWERRRDVLVVDGIYGTGYRPSHNSLMSRVYQCIAQLSCPVISIDIPSGIDASSGYRSDLNDDAPPKAIQATDTITFGAPKMGQLLGEGPTHCGQLYCVDIGLRPWPNTGTRALILSDEFCDRRYWCDFGRDLDVHKGRCGHVAIIGGADAMPGSVSMSARAALRAGCGLVTIAARAPMRTQDEIMVRGILNDDGTLCDNALQDVLSRADCLVIGPGLGRDDTAIQIIQACSRFKGRIVLDADALWALAETPIRFESPECFATPHPAEAARLCGVSAREILFSPVTYAQQIVEKYRVTAIIKSHASVIASKRGGAMRLGILPYPNPSLATAGAGDVLAGILGGILAQARNGAVSHWFDAFEVAAMALNCHSRAGRICARELGNSLCASDLIDHIRV